MQPIISEIRQLIATKQHETAVKTLLAYLKQGDHKVYMRAKKLLEVPVKAGEAGVPVTPGSDLLDQFLDELLKKHSPLLNFLNEWKQGLAAWEIQSWEKAATHFQKALKLHRKSYTLKASELEEYLRLSRQGKQMQQFLNTGYKLQYAGKWKAAREAFESALKLYQESFTLSRDKITQAITYCDMGLKFEHQLGKARHRLTHENWEEALAAYQEARRLYCKGFQPDLATIDYEIQLCREAIASSNSLRLAGLLGKIQRNPVLIMLAIGACLLCAIWAVLMLDVLQPAAKAQPPAMAEQAPRLALLPFCDQEDPASLNVSLPVSIEVSRALRARQGKQFTLISDKELQAALQELGMERGAGCDPAQFTRIGQALQARYMLVGEVHLQPDEGITLIYHLFEGDSIRPEPLLELYSTDLQELRSQLKEQLGSLIP
ncbi:MAG: tetratricopeptide repeat protein [Bacteroidetes bacterium]|nr:MAG: tetratricopeptide repeat protein [Bacteroidota bacterium]